MLSISAVVFATSYTTSVIVYYNAYYAGADRSYTGNRYCLSMKVNTITDNNTSTTPKFLVVHNSYLLGVKISTDTLSSFTKTVNKGYSYVCEFPNSSIGSGTRAFDFSTTVGHSGFSASPVILESYN